MDLLTILAMVNPDTGNPIVALLAGITMIIVVVIIQQEEG